MTRFELTRTLALTTCSDGESTQKPCPHHSHASVSLPYTIGWKVLTMLVGLIRSTLPDRVHEDTVFYETRNDKAD